MWLINTTNHRLEEFFGSDTPRYAILSHTWEDEEVSFQEFGSPSAMLKKGWSKIKRTCDKALKHGYKYAWVDTCCIDKRSSAELTESINSMYRWYQGAGVCYVYLSDLPADVPVLEGLKTCRWFTRGWTLQELIAPRDIRFYGRDWQWLGTKKTVRRTDFENYRHQTNRTTKRDEDMAYCLLGIFDVTMPMLYGEGMRAFSRLQEEIIKRSNDMTIFAWTQPEGQQEDASGALFAPSPAFFAQSGDINVFGRRFMDLDFVLTNKGLRMDKCVDVYEVIPKTDTSLPHATGFVMPLGYRKLSDPEPDEYDIYLNLWKVGPNYFLRESISRRPDNCRFVSSPMLSFYIVSDTQDLLSFKRMRLTNAVHFPRIADFKIQHAIPQSHWDHSRQLFFAPYTSGDLVLAAYIKITLAPGIETQVVLCVNFSRSKGGSLEPRCLIFDEESHNDISVWLFRHKRLGYNGHDATWSDVRENEKEMLDFTPRL
ncbi:heterokaryon incompatibility protein-domain-containing protein [Cadophora sp. MPI-SDFR-AT-0126]|nr:heterokaryon incompatibility protein-domain-containing protein [Leotiomycetes sp. MPI-SDFR-AT-0126]